MVGDRWLMEECSATDEQTCQSVTYICVHPQCTQLRILAVEFDTLVLFSCILVALLGWLCTGFQTVPVSSARDDAISVSQMLLHLVYCKN